MGAVKVVFFLTAISRAFAQDGSLERDSIHQLGQNRNTSIVNSCFLDGRLNCVLRNNSLIIEDQIWLQNINIGVVTCNSSISPMFIYSNGTVMERDNLRCPTTVPLGQLKVVFDLDVFFNETINFTVIDVEIYAQQQGGNIELFRKTSLILSGQVPYDDCIVDGGLILPPIDCTDVTTTTGADISTTTSADVSTTNNAAVTIISNFGMLVYLMITYCLSTMS